jgi:hypothetical protein
MIIRVHLDIQIKLAHAVGANVLSGFSERLWPEESLPIIASHAVGHGRVGSS